MMRNYDRSELLALVPERYLADGYVASDGQPWPALRSDYAAAAGTQFAAAGLSPQELGFTLEAIRLLLPEHEDHGARARLQDTVEEALQVVARAIQQPNNKGLVKWLSACVEQVGTEADIEAFVAHMQAVRLQYAVLVSLPQPGSPSPSPSAS